MLNPASTWSRDNTLFRPANAGWLGNRADLTVYVHKGSKGWKAPVEPPMTGVSQTEVMTFLQQLQRRLRGGIPRGYVFRLPTDAEWEYALRGGSTDPDDPYVGPYHPREVWSTVGVFPEEKADLLAKAGIKNVPKDWFGASPCAVCTKKPNGWGIYDMIGNVDEWVMDRFPIWNPDGTYKKSGAGVLSEITYQPIETDPLRWHDKTDSTGLVRANSSGNPSGVRKFCPPSARHRVLGFRPVLGPDLEKEWKNAARAGKKGRR